MANVNYQELTQYNSPNYTPYAQVPSVYGMPRTIDGITYHWWGDPATQPQFNGVINWLCRSNGNSSANVVGENGRIAWIVDAINAAWHAGNARGNATTVGYECNPRLDDGDYQTMGEFHYVMEKAYKKTLAIWVHKQWSTTACSPIDKGRIRRIADELHAQDVAPAPVVPQWVAMDKPRPMVAAVDLYVKDLDANKNVGNVIKKGTQIDFAMKKDIDNATYLRSKYSTEKNLNYGILLTQLAELPAPDPQPEWIRNLNDIEDVKLSVLPAEGVKVLNLTSFTPVNDTIIPKGTQIDIAKETTIGGKKYYLSSYAVSKGLPWGIAADLLGTPIITPPAEKPEWLKNLQDVTDQDFWTRSEATVLSLADGSTTRKLPVNTKIRITHTTEIIGEQYMVLQPAEGAEMSEVIQTIYLSDHEITSPNDDLETRVSLLEKIVNTIVAFLTNMFKNFKI